MAGKPIKKKKQHPVISDSRTIGQRLRVAREALRLTQHEVAEELEIGRDTYVSYEMGRSRLKWSIGHKFCSTFIISQMWLAIGEGPMRRYILPSSEATKAFEVISPGASFSDVFSLLLERDYRNRLADQSHDFLYMVSIIDAFSDKYAKRMLDIKFQAWLSLVKDPARFTLKYISLGNQLSQLMVRDENLDLAKVKLVCGSDTKNNSPA